MFALLVSLAQAGSTVSPPNPSTLLPPPTPNGIGQVFPLNDYEGINPNIKNLVVLVLENRSFDSFLGRMKLDGFNPLVNGPEYTASNTLQNGTVVYLRNRHSVTEALDLDSYNPGHEVPDISQQLYGTYAAVTNGTAALNSGFAQNAFRNAASQSVSANTAVDEVMSLHGADTIPVTYALAQEFGVVDEWFASVPGPTYPNRHFVHCATSLGKTSNNLNVFGGSGVNVFTGLECKTVYSNLNDNGVSWGYFHSGLEPGFALYEDFRNPLNLLKTHTMDTFFSQAKEGSLPTYSFIEPAFGKNDNHPGPENLYAGEALVKSIYDALRNSPQWESTLFVLTYDEHGGFYDHVSPPVNVPPPDDSKPDAPSGDPIGDFHFDRLGVRVPTILISPWIPKGAVFRSGIDGRYFEHSSISGTLTRMLGLDKFLTNRDAWALSFHSAVNYLTEPRTDCMPNVPLFQ